MYDNLTAQERRELCAKLSRATRELSRLVIELGEVALYTLAPEERATRMGGAVWTARSRFQRTRDFIEEASAELCEACS